MPPVSTYSVPPEATILPEAVAPGALNTAVAVFTSATPVLTTMPLPVALMMVEPGRSSTYPPLAMLTVDMVAPA